MNKDSTDSSNVVSMDELKETFKDDASMKEEVKRSYVGLDAEKLAIQHLDLMAMDVSPEREFIISPILHKGGFALLHAAAGVGKSHFCFNIAYAIAQGGRFLKYEAPKAQKILYIDGELGQEEVFRYVKQIENKLGKLRFPENLCYFTVDKFPQANIPKLDTPEGRQFYTDYAIKHGIKAIFADNLKLLTTDFDENKTGDWNPIQAWIIDMRKRGIAVFLIHHAGDNPRKQRGTSARIDAAHIVISLQRLGEIGEGKVLIEYQKGRHLTALQAEKFEALNHFNGEWSFVEREVSTYQAVIDLFKIGANGVTVATRLNISPARVSVYKRRAYDEGRLERDRHGKIIVE